ncbi:MAG: general stress protein [Naasia sp.]
MTTTDDSMIATTAPVSYRETLASYPDYESAQSTVDRLSDSGFPVERTAIVGHGVSIVEQIEGRMTKGRAAGLGAASGAWFGLFLGLLFGIFAPGLGWLAILVTSLALGALWGAVFGFFGHLATGGRRDFSSSRSLQADRYDVLVDAALLEQARHALDGRASTTTTPSA